MSTANNALLCPEDALILQALTVEINQTVVVIELLRMRAEEMLSAASMLRGHGAHGHEILKRAVRATANITAAERARSELKRVADYTDDMSSEFMATYCALLEATHAARIDLLGLCFIDDTARKPWVTAQVP